MLALLGITMLYFDLLVTFKLQTYLGQRLSLVPS